MCSFLITNRDIEDISVFNKKLKRRGPDHTSTFKKDNIIYLHNLLHITGERTLQPLHNNNTVFLYNGEVYGYTGKSDTEYIYKTFLSKGIDSFKNLDGEFAIVLVHENKIFLITDTFGTKPIFYSKKNSDFGISSYYSVLKEMGFEDIKRVAPNTIFELISEKESVLHNFNLNQTIDTFDMWEEAFIKSVDKRINAESFLCLSSGYDSGAIALASKILNKSLSFYCIPKLENDYIINEREKFLGKVEYLEVDEQTYLKHFNLIDSFCDDHKIKNYDFKNDKASVGLSVILSKAIQDGKRVSISGSGADEVITDYGINGRSVFFMDNSSTLKGIFPEDLSSVFPWNNFFFGRQEQYLYKEEAVAGCHGVETRYPFLDRETVQAFLNLKHTLKNKEYKAPIAKFFNKYNFAYEPNIKRGFNI